VDQDHPDAEESTAMARLEKLTPMLQTSDMPATIAFYTGVLGFTLVNTWPEGEPTWCILRRDSAQLMFMINEHVGAPQMTGTLYIETDDVLDLHGRIAGRAEVLWGPEVYPYGMHEFAIKDCNGYTLSFGQPTNDPAAGGGES
jgi:catechol 2,3-dioxygenase-like lactoylglutathione lyase family enzyme